MGACDRGSIFNRVKKLPQNAIRWQWGGGDLWELVTGLGRVKLGKKEKSLARSFM